jgi:hypothetical protein
MGNFCPYWDERSPILGIDAGIAGDRRDMVVKGFFCEVVETALADGPHKARGELVRPTVQPGGPIGWASPRYNPGHHEPIRNEHFGLSTRGAPFSPNLAVKATRSTCGDGEPGNRRLCAI